MSPGEISEIIKSEILAAGFDRCGITEATELSREKGLFMKWLDRGSHADMDFLKRNFEKRTDPGILFQGAKSVAVAVINYYTGRQDESPGMPVVSRYVTRVDYHTVVRERLHQALAASRKKIPGLEGRVCVDSAPVMEKALAVRAGLGNQGRNSLLIVQGGGSFYFIGVIIINLETEYDSPDLTDPCGTCRKCIESCPTGAISEEGFLDAGRCISYLTVEHRGEIPGQFRGKLRNRIFGCDICQEVCPHNCDASLTDIDEFARDKRLDTMTLKEWAYLTPEGFKTIFAGTTVERRGYEAF
ncbi:MAG: tRNA epoxyqueuosine(34) reductase QueG, partial [Bacteroidales bacterium]